MSKLGEEDTLSYASEKAQMAVPQARAGGGDDSATGHDYGLCASQPLKRISITLPSADIKGESHQPWSFLF